MSSLSRYSAALLLATSFAQPGAAHPRLVAASPAPNATVARPNRIELRFSERLVARFSGIALTPVGHGGVPPLAIALSQNGTGLIATPGAPIAPGAYRVSWHAVSVDTHRLEGNYTFRVR
jgi:methionine-rich copper-binding protein CopC